MFISLEFIFVINNLSSDKQRFIYNLFIMNHKIVIIAGPSGVGKATIETELFKASDLKLCFSCSATTRLPRHGEVDGKQYYFLTEAEFDKKIANNEFLEWNAHFAHKYGTLNDEITRILAKGCIPFLEVDVEGAKRIIKKVQDKYNLITIFIMPPSIVELERRIRNRNTENEQELQSRLQRYHKEINDSKIFQHIIMNKNVQETVAQITRIIKEA